MKLRPSTFVMSMVMAQTRCTTAHSPSRCLFLFPLRRQQFSSFTVKSHQIYYQNIRHHSVLPHRSLHKGSQTESQHFKCRHICLQSSFTSFELCLFELGRSRVVLCAVIYRPPKYNKAFINDFSEFLAEIPPKYDRVLIIGDFNIHTCCPDEPISRNFLNVIDS